MKELNVIEKSEFYKENNIVKGTTICSVCGEEKENMEFTFYLTRLTKDGKRLMVNTNCKKCQSIRAKELRVLKKIHKRPEFGTLCDCCGKPVLKNFQLDHEHGTTNFRGWLCKDCNVGLGKLGDTIEGLKKALEYLKRSKNNGNK